MKRNAKRLLALLLVLTLCVGLFPGVAFAEGDDPTEEPAPVGVGVRDDPNDGSEGDGGPTEPPAPAEEPEDPAPTEAGEDEPLQPAEPAAPPEGEPEDEPDALLPADDVAATGSGTCGDNLTWTLDDAGTLTISGTGDMWDYRYYSAGDFAPWYDSHDSIQAVVIKPGVTTIGGWAFCYCENLTSVTIPEGVTTIGNGAFSHCSSLTSITIPGGVTSFGIQAFLDCSSLTSITIPEGVTSIGHSAFAYCSSLTSITIPASVTSIGNYAFAWCSSLTSVTIPEGVANIGNGAFEFCSSLTSVTIPASVTTIGDSAFLYCSSLTSITIPEGVTTIGGQAFSGCRSLTDIYYGGTVSRWNTFGVSLDRYRTTVHCSDGEILPIEKNRCGDNLTWTLDDAGTLTISGTGDMWDFRYDTTPWYDQSDSIQVIVLKPGVTSIGNGAFEFCSSLTNITIPESVTSIGDYAFSRCSSLTDIYYGGTVSQWNALGTAWDRYRTSVHCSDGEILLAEKNCCGDNLTWTLDDAGTLTISGAGDMWDFDYNTMPWYEQQDSIRVIVLKPGVTSIGNYAFAYCSSSLTSVTIPEGVTSIGDYAFYYCTSLTSITIPSSVTNIRDGAFCNCIKLTNITIPESVTNIGMHAFSSCSSLTEITFTGHAPSISDNAFQGDTLTAYYPANDPTWTEDVRQNYGGTITWVPYELDLADSSSLRLDREYLILEEGDAVSLTLPGIPDGLLSLVTWTAESAETDGAAPVRVADGLVTAVAPGSAWVKAELSLGGVVYTARCRVDVVADQAGVDSPIADDVKWNGVRLTSSKATVELFKTDYARVEIIPVLSRNISAQSNVIPQSPEIPEGVGAIRSARFAGDAANELFALRVADDRTLEIIPRDSALLLGESKPASIKGSYKTTILVNIDGTELETGALTLTVKKSKPAVTVKAVKLNSAFRGDEQPLVFAKGEVTAIEPVGAAPSWLRVDAENLRLGYDGSANGKNSAKLKLLVTIDGWAIRKELTVSVSSAPTAPTISPKAATLTLLPAAGNEVSTTVKVSPAVYTDAARFPITVSRIEEAKVGSFENGSVLIAEIAGGVLTVRPGPALDSSKAHTFKLYLSVNGKEKAVTVKTTALKAPTLTLKAAGFVDSALPGSSITLTATAKSYLGLCEPVLRVQKTKAATKTSPAVDEDVTGLFVLTPAPGQGKAAVTLRAADPAAIEKGYTYTAYLSLRLPDGTRTAEAKVKLNLKWSDPAKLKASATVKAAGFIDVLRAGSEAKLTPTVKNCYDWAMTPGDLTVTRTYNGSAKQKVSEDWTDRFAVRVEDGAWYISIREGAAVSHADKFTVSATLRSPSAGELAAKAVTVTVKQGTVKISQSVKAVTLLRDDRFSRGVVTLTPTDSALRIARVELDAASLTRFELTELENGAWAIGLAGNRLNTAKTATVKLRVFLEGNLTATPNATISVKVSFR